jgi:hypothetical protein
MPNFDPETIRKDAKADIDRLDAEIKAVDKTIKEARASRAALVKERKQTDSIYRNLSPRAPRKPRAPKPGSVDVPQPSNAAPSPDLQASVPASGTGEVKSTGVPGGETPAAFVAPGTPSQP